MKRLLIGVLLLASMSGCVDRRFVYKPDGALSGAPKLPVKIAVLPFADGTENFTRRGGLVSKEVYKVNLAKSAGGDMIDPLPPEFWSKSLADEMAASGRFESVRFLYDRSELTDEDFFVEGTLEKAYLDFGTSGAPHEFGIALRTTRRADALKVWEGSFRKVPDNSTWAAGRCQTKRCQVDLYHGVVNRAMQEMFVDAGTDLAQGLAAFSEGGAGSGAKPPGAALPGTVDETIESILKAK